jgi:uncharacterized membrane protein
VALRVQTYRCLLLALAAGAMLLYGWHWHQPALIGSGAGCCAVLPWLCRRSWNWAINALILLCAGLIGFVIGHFGAMALTLKLFACIASLALAAYFLHTLFPPHTALITAIGEASRGPLGPQLRAYTRGITWFWGLFLLLCAVVALGQLCSVQILEHLYWLPAWQLPLSMLVFVGEFYLRKRLFPAHNHPGFREYLSIVAQAMAKPPRTRL